MAAGSHWMVCKPWRWAHIHAVGTENSNVSDISITDETMIRMILSLDFFIGMTRTDVQSRRYINATAMAAIPSSRPVNPSRSVVVALTDTLSASMPKSSAMVAAI